MEYNLKKTEIPIPDLMKNLPLTNKGYLKPWFVSGDDFRVVDPRKAALAIQKKACWICGNKFDSQKYALVGSPSVAMARICREPPCHIDCVIYALQVCPFILYPNSKRRSAGLPKEATIEEFNKTSKVKVDGQNPGEYIMVVVNNFAFDMDHLFITYNESAVLWREFWIGGVKQENVPDPLYPLEKLPVALQKMRETSER